MTVFHILVVLIPKLNLNCTVCGSWYDKGWIQGGGGGGGGGGVEEDAISPPSPLEAMKMPEMQSKNLASQSTFSC